MGEIQALIFDLDNTLVDRDEAFGRFLMDSCKEIDKEKLDNLIEWDNRGQGDRLKLFTAMATEVHETEANLLWEIFQEKFPSYFFPNPEILKLLEKLESEGFEMSILSNGGERLQRGKILNSGLDRFFGESNTWISDNIGVAKPDPGAFYRVMDHFDIAKEGPQMMMIGDQWEIDILPARELGMATFHVESFPQIFDLETFLKEMV